VDTLTRKIREAGDERGKELGQLLGILESKAGDVSLAGRLKTVERLEVARSAEAQRGRTGSWLYDVGRHLNLCAALRHEYAALAGIFPVHLTQQRPDAKHDDGTIEGGLRP
jgi:hypothetical protein